MYVCACCGVVLWESHVTCCHVTCCHVGCHVGWVSVGCRLGVGDSRLCRVGAGECSRWCGMFWMMMAWGGVVYVYSRVVGT
jgi:hypothetical protein